MSRAQAESVIKNIIREIAQECASKGQAVSETLVAFMVCADIFSSCFYTLPHNSYFYQTLYHAIQNFNNSEKKSFGKYCWKRRKKTNIFSFSHNVFNHPETLFNCIYFVIFKCFDSSPV